MKIAKIIVKTKNNKYPIIVGSDLVKNFLNIVKKNSLNFNKCLLIVDTKVPKKFVKEIKVLFILIFDTGLTTDYSEPLSL